MKNQVDKKDKSVLFLKKLNKDAIKKGFLPDPEINKGKNTTIETLIKILGEIPACFT